MMLKKILLPIILMLPLSFVQAITVNEIVEKAASDWQKEAFIVKPEFSLIDLQGNTHTHTSTQGKYLVVNFWATWCPPCLKEIPALVEFYEQNQDKVEVLGLDYEQADRAGIVEFVDSFMVSYPIVLFDEHNGPQFPKFGDIFGMPTTYVYNPQGQLVDFRMGEVDEDFLQQAILK